MDTVIILAGGGAPSLAEDLPVAELVVAADGGYAHAEKLGLRVDVAVGDFDSMDIDELPAHVVVERHPADKDSTDLELAFELVIRDRPGRVIVVGGGGGRLDHELAIAGLICSDRWETIEDIDWVSNRGWAHVVRRRKTVHADIGTILTVLPVGGPCRGITTTGLKWNLENSTLDSGTTLGVSNLMVSPVADIRVETGVLLVLLPA